MVVYLSAKVFKVVCLFVLQVKKIKTDLQKAATIPVSQISRIAGQENAKNPIQVPFAVKILVGDNISDVSVIIPTSES